MTRRLFWGMGYDTSFQEKCSSILKNVIQIDLTKHSPKSPISIMSEFGDFFAQNGPPMKERKKRKKRGEAG